MDNRFKFRGMNKGKWYYGGYFKHLPYTPQPIRHSEVPEKDYKHLIIQDSFSDWGLPRNMTCIEVEPETVGQCTGLKDKNGNLIFEGDIIAVQYIGAQIPLFSRQFSNLPEDERFAIVYNYDWHKFCCENPNYKKTCEIHSLDLDAIQINTENKQYEVIGNIYENPELLEEKQC